MVGHVSVKSAHVVVFVACAALALAWCFASSGTARQAGQAAQPRNRVAPVALLPGPSGAAPDAATARSVDARSDDADGVWRTQEETVSVLLGRLRRSSFYDGASPAAPDWRMFRERIWRDAESYIQFLRTIENDYASDTPFLEFLLQVCGPITSSLQVDIRGRVTDLGEYLTRRLPHQIRLLASLPFRAHRAWVGGDVGAPRLSQADRDHLFALIRGQLDEDVVGNLAGSLAIYLGEDPSIGSWFISGIRSAGLGKTLRADLTRYYVEGAKLDATSIDMAVHVLGDLDPGGRSKVLDALCLFCTDPELIQVSLPSIRLVAESDSSSRCRGSALALLLRVDDPQVFSLGLEMMNREQSKDARSAALLGLAFTMDFPATARDRFRAGLSYLSDPDESIQGLALDALYYAVKSAVARQDFGNASAAAHQTIDTIRTLNDTASRQRLKQRLIDKLKANWPEAFNSADLQAQLDAIR